MGTHGGRNRKKSPRIRKKLPPGTAPGTLPVHAEQQAIRIHLISYKGADFYEGEIEDISQVKKLSKAGGVTWLNIYGISNSDVIEKVGQLYDFHRLALEDVVNNHQRPKYEQYGAMDYIVLRMISSPDDLVSEQLSLFLRDGVVVTFQERGDDCLEGVRNRLKNRSGRIRNLPACYLAYAIMDSIIDTYFPVLELFADHLDTLEEQILSGKLKAEPARIHEVKNEITGLRRIIWSHRDMLSHLLRDFSRNFDADTVIYLRDCQDHVLQQLDLADTYRDQCSSLMDLSFSIADHDTNEIMKVLTVIASIFIPLTFVAGIYGMNFDTSKPLNMPELAYEYGYPAVLGVMLLITVSLLVFFKKRKWF